MNRRQFVASLGAAAAPRRPLNFIFLLIDDLGWTDLGCFGSTFYETPNIDRLARGGLRFTNAYAACPVCSPTRAAVMTGQYPARLHLTDWIPGRKQWETARLLTPAFSQQLPLEETTIAEMLQPAGYRSASIGKWHLGREPFYPDRQGFDLNVAGSDRGSPASYFGPFDLPNFKGGTREDYLTDRLTDEAEKFIEQNRDRQFFAYLPHYAVHIPLQARQQIVARYQAKPTRPGGHNHAVYAAVIEAVDVAVGRLMRKLADLKIAERTVIFFTSDNGGLRFEGGSKTYVTSNAPLRAGKGHLYEGGVRVPLIVHWPGAVKPGTVCDTPVSSIDYLPTIRELAGADTPSVDGVSIAPLFRGSGRLQREALYWHYPHYSNQGGSPGGSVRAGDWKLIEFYEDGRLELFNLKEDPGERRNLARREQERSARLHAMLKRWRASVNAAMPAPNPRYDPARAGQGLTGAEAPTDPL